MCGCGGLRAVISGLCCRSEGGFRQVCYDYRRRPAITTGLAGGEVMHHAWIISFLVSSLFLFPACHKETEEDRVNKVITSVQKAAEEKKIMTVLDQVSRAYRDPQERDYDGIKGLLAFYFYRHQKVRVYIPSREVTVTGAAATASFEAVLTGAAPGETSGSVVPGALGVYRFNVDLRKEEGRWKVTSSQWERIGDQMEGMTSR